MSPIASSQVLQGLEDYDLFYKNFFSHPEVIISLLHDLLPEELDTLLDLSTLKAIETTQILHIGSLSISRIMDKIWTADFKTAEQTPVSRQLRLLIMTEFQHYNQKYIIFRILSYYSILLFQSLEEYRKGIAPYPLILPVVLVDLSGNRKWTAPNSTHELLPVTAPQTVRRCCPEFEFFVCNAADYAERELPETAGPAAQLMRLAAGKRAGTHKVQSIIKQIIKLQRAGDHRFSRQIIADLFDYITQQPSLAYTILEAKTDQEASGIME